MYCVSRRNSTILSWRRFTAREHEQQELEQRDRRSYRAEIPVRPAPRGSGKGQSTIVPDGFTRSCAGTRAGTSCSSTTSCDDFRIASPSVTSYSMVRTRAVVDQSDVRSLRLGQRRGRRPAARSHSNDPQAVHAYPVVCQKSIASSCGAPVEVEQSAEPLARSTGAFSLAGRTACSAGVSSRLPTP